MAGELDLPATGPVQAPERAAPDIAASVVEEVGEGIQGEESSGADKYVPESKGLAERARVELRNRLGRVGDEIFDEDDSAEVRILEEEPVVRGTQGWGPLWKLSLWATLSFASYILLSVPRVEPKWIPNISEREPIPKIYRPHKAGTGSPRRTS